MTTTYPVHLDYLDVVRKARKAYLNGALQMQQPKIQLSSCSYSGPCAIGVSLTPEVRRAFDNHRPPTMQNLLAKGLVTTDNSYKLQLLQLRHDDLVIIRHGTIKYHKNYGFSQNATYHVHALDKLRQFQSMLDIPLDVELPSWF